MIKHTGTWRQSRLMRALRSLRTNAGDEEE